MRKKQTRKKKLLLRKTTKRKTSKKSSSLDFLEFIDSDADGLSDELEKKLGTDPLSADTDKDGLSDLAETKVYHTDPLNPDTDYDGISDSEEVRVGLNPLKPNKLKDFFIPHAGNDHKPYLLHPKRALFYSGFFITLKAIVFVFALSIPLQAFMMPDVLAQQRDKLLVLVRELRQEQGLSNLSDSTKLISSSQAKADDMVQYEYFSHLGPNNRDLSYFLGQADYLYRFAGENLAMGFRKPESVIKAWMKSPMHYQNLIDKDFQDTGLGIEGGEYEGKETVFIAQHFGTPVVEVRSMPAQGGSASGGNSEVRSTPSSAEATEDKEKEAVEIDEVLGEKVQPPSPTERKVALTPGPSPTLDVAGEGDATAEEQELIYLQDRSKVFWKYDGKQTTFTAEAYIVGEVDKAFVYINDYPLILRPDTSEYNLYSGKLTIQENIDNFFKVVVAPTIIIQAKDGQKITNSIGWYKIKVVDQTPVEKYFAAKTILPAAVTKVFGVSKVIYIIAITVFVIVLLLTILVEIKKQHPHLIVQTLGVILLLVTLFLI